MMTRQCIFLLSFCQLLFFWGFSQTGPGGVGSNDGTSNLVLWLDADTETAVSGSTVTSWNDRSGFAHHLTAGNGAVFQSAARNGYSTFNFDGTSHYFERAYTAALGPNNFSVFSANNVTSSNTYKAVISNRDDPAGNNVTAGFILYSRSSTNRWEFWTGNSTTNWNRINTATSTAGSWAGQAILHSNGLTNGKNIYINSNLIGTATHTMTPNPNRPIRVGAGQNETTPNFYFVGDMGEIIMYNTVVNNAQKIIVENYLAAKYDYTLTSNDVYDEDNAGNGNYDHDVAGIGRVDASNIHNDAQGTGIIRILNPVNLDNDEFLLWGHDNGTLVANNTTDIPSTVTAARLNRVWRVSEVNTSGSGVNVGAHDLRVDLTGISGFSPSYLPQLLVDTNNDGVFTDETPIEPALHLGSNIYEFTGITALTNNSRFTFGIVPHAVITNRNTTYRVNKN